MVEVEYADLVGRPFVMGARGPDAYDCYGLVREMFRRTGKQVPDYSTERRDVATIAQILSGIREWRKVEFAPGVMALFQMRTCLHTSFILPYDKMIHCWEQSNGVCVERFSTWQGKVIGYYDY